MKIKNVIYSLGQSGFFNQDLAAVKAGAKIDCFYYSDAPVTNGFNQILQTGQALSVMLILEDGQVAYGDCLDVIFAGAAGRDSIFRAQEHLNYLETRMRDFLIGQDLNEFKLLAIEIDNMQTDQKPLHTALRYGLTQAILHAVSLANRITMTQVVAREYGTEIMSEAIPILANVDAEDWISVDKVIMKQVELLPHGAFENVERDLGLQGEKLIAYATRLISRIEKIGGRDYQPKIHFDLYGSLGELFDNDIEKLVDYLPAIQEIIRDRELLLESPIVASNQQEQIRLFKLLRSAIQKRNLNMKLVVDEWCNTFEDIKKFEDENATDFVQVKTPDLGGINNTIEALLYCRRRGIGVCLGGSANETDQSTKITTQIGLACHPDFMLAKPGFGNDEALMIQRNEMNRTLNLIKNNDV